jgi:hypothetical protein
MKQLAEESHATTKALRALEQDRLDALLAAAIPLALAGHLGGIDRAVAIIERQSRLLGLSTAALRS